MAGSIKEVYVSHTTILPGTKMWPRTIFQKIFKNELKHILYLTSKGGATYNEKKTIFRNSLTTEARWSSPLTWRGRLYVHSQKDTGTYNKINILQIEI